jgi:hypothetical protein
MVHFLSNLQQKVAEIPVLTSACLSLLFSTCNNTSRTYKQGFVRFDIGWLTKICWQIPGLVKTLTSIMERYVKTYLHFCIYLERNAPSIYQSEKHFWQKLQEKMTHFVPHMLAPYVCRCIILCTDCYYRPKVLQSGTAISWTQVLYPVMKIMSRWAIAVNL